MKKTLLITLAIFSLSLFADNNSEKRSLDPNTLVKDLTSLDKILITDYTQVKYGSFDNIFVRRPWTGIGRTCHFATTKYVRTSYILSAGTLLSIKDVELETEDTSGTGLYLLKLTTKGGFEIQCLGTRTRKLKVKALERIFNYSIKFVREKRSFLQRMKDIVSKKTGL